LAGQIKGKLPPSNPTEMIKLRKIKRTLVPVKDNIKKKFIIKKDIRGHKVGGKKIMKILRAKRRHMQKRRRNSSSSSDSDFLRQA